MAYLMSVWRVNGRVLFYCSDYLRYDTQFCLAWFLVVGFWMDLSLSSFGWILVDNWEFLFVGTPTITTV